MPVVFLLLKREQKFLSIKINKFQFSLISFEIRNQLFKLKIFKL